MDADDDINIESLYEAISNITNDKQTIDIHLAPYSDEHSYTLKHMSKEAIALEYLEKPYGKHLIHHCWSKIYRTEWLKINGIMFPDHWVIYEDLSFVSKAISKARLIGIGDSNYYRYNGAGSLSSKMHTNQADFYESCKRYSKLITDKKLAKTSLQKSLAYFFHKIYVNIEGKPRLMQWYILFRMLLIKDIWKSLRKYPEGNKWQVKVLEVWMLSCLVTPISATFNRVNSKK